MELREIWKVIVRRWWLVAIPAVVALAYAAYGYLKSPPTGGYSTSIRFTAGSPCDNEALGYQDCRYYPWLTSEYVINALTDWVKTTSFAQAVSDELKGQGIAVTPSQIQGGIVSDNARSVMLVTISAGDARQVQAIAGAASKVLQTRSNQFFPQIGPAGIQVNLLDEPVVTAVPPSLTAQLNPLLRFVLGLAAGIALTFLVDYLDPTVRERAEIEALGLRVLAEVPKR